MCMYACVITYCYLQLSSFVIVMKSLYDQSGESVIPGKLLSTFRPIDLHF